MGQGHISTTRGSGGNIHVTRHKYGEGFAPVLCVKGRSRCQCCRLSLVARMWPARTISTTTSSNSFNFSTSRCTSFARASKAGSSIPSSSGSGTPKRQSQAAVVGTSAGAVSLMTSSRQIVVDAGCPLLTCTGDALVPGDVVDMGVGNDTTVAARPKVGDAIGVLIGGCPRCEARENLLAATNQWKRGAMAKGRKGSSSVVDIMVGVGRA